MNQSTLTITTDPSPLAISIHDSAMNLVAEAVSPAENLKLAPGIYLVQASRPSKPDLAAVAQVFAGSARALHLTAEEPNAVQRLKANAFTGFERVVRRVQTPVLVPVQAPAPQSLVKKPEVIWVRFLWLYDWDTAQVIRAPDVNWRSTAAELILEVSSLRRHVTFLQMTNGKGTPLNVALPPGGFTRPVRCEVAVSESQSRLAARVQLSTTWANAALQYMAQGFLEQAQRVIDEAARQEPAGHFSWLHRFEDPAAALVARYLRFRTDSESVGDTVKNLLLDPLQKLADGLVLSAETLARQSNNALACQQLIRIPAGALPLYTEGFALLTNRLRELLEGEDSADEATMERLRELRKKMAKWAPYVDLSSPTLTFPGEGIASPRLGLSNETPLESAGWIPVRERSVIETVRSAMKSASPPTLDLLDLDTRASIPAELIVRIDQFTAECVRLYRRKKGLHNLTTGALMLASLGVVAAGVYDAPELVTAFGVAVTVLFAVGRFFKFEQRQLEYRTLISEARILATEAKNGRISAPRAIKRLKTLIFREAFSATPVAERRDV